MGADKALLEVGGVALARRAHDTLQAAGAERVIAVGGDAAGLGALGLTVVADREPGAGPLGGVLTGLASTSAGVVVVLACDQPAVTPALVRRLVTVLDEQGAAVAVPLVGGVRQVLCAALDRSVADGLAAAFAAGERSLTRALHAVEVADVAGIDGALVADLDDPDDLRRYAQEPPPQRPAPR